MNYLDTHETKANLELDKLRQEFDKKDNPYDHDRIVEAIENQLEILKAIKILREFIK